MKDVYSYLIIWFEYPKDRLGNTKETKRLEVALGEAALITKCAELKAHKHVFRVYRIGAEVISYKRSDEKWNYEPLKDEKSE